MREARQTGGRREVAQVAPAETRIILRVAEEQLGVRGDYVEMGCYKGETSVELQRVLVGEGARRSGAGGLGAFGGGAERLGAEADAGGGGAGAFGDDAGVTFVHRLYIYDSFAGLPEKTAQDASAAGEQFRAGELAVTKREVVERFRRANLPVPVVKKGFFEELGAEDLPEEIAFAFLDGDFYESIRVSLGLVAPRVGREGVILVHDYNNPGLPGAGRAVEEFLRGGEFGMEVRGSLAILKRRGG